MAPADPASRAGVTPEASGDWSSGTFANKMTAPLERPAGFGVWILSCGVGLLALPIVVWILMPLVFGADRRDSSAVWGLAGLAPLFAVVFTSPIYFFGQIAAFCFFRSRSTPPATFLYSAIVGITSGALAACIYWQANGGGRILQAN